tara:strand:- start:3344 stop:5098 length:1755 start_codon:yes stop_codon:yes gene_type:complete
MNIDALVEDFYRNEDDNSSLINEVLKLLITEQTDMPAKARFDWSMIPDIPISEIGWSDVSTTEEGVDIPSEQRALLQQYLDNIGSPGASFEEQIKSLQEFYGPAGPQMVTANASNNAEAISQLISYLVFYKTLTKVVTNFNAASAGFSFESFLAVLLDGQQVPANTGTIADFITGDGTPISLKLYTNLHVGGSWRDLVGDITAPQFNHPQGRAMRYISGIKILSGEGLDQKGEIKLYQFDITLDNIVDIMLNSMHPDIVKMPASMIAGGEGIADKIPSADRVPSNEELEKELLKVVRSGLDNIEVSEAMQQIDPGFSLDKFVNGPDGIFKLMQYANEGRKDLFAKNWNGLAYTKMGSVGKLQQFIFDEVFLPKYSEASAWKDIKSNAAKQRVVAFIKTLAKDIKTTHDTMVDSFGSSEVAKAREGALRDVDWLSVKSPRKLKGNEEYNDQMVANREQVSSYYNGLDEAGKIEALKNTYGMVVGGAGGITQWDLNANQATSDSYPVNAEYLGELRIGGAYVEQMLTQVSEMLNQEIFSVFTSLKSLSDNLNGFFAGGLKDNKKAVTAIASAQDIEEKTTELKSEK